MNSLKSGQSTLTGQEVNTIDEELNDWLATPPSLNLFNNGQSISKQSWMDLSLEEKLYGILTTLEGLVNRLSLVDTKAQQILLVLTTLEDTSLTEGSTQISTAPTRDNEWSSSIGSGTTKKRSRTRSSRTSKMGTSYPQSMNVENSDSDHHTW